MSFDALEVIPPPITRDLHRGYPTRPHAGVSPPRPRTPKEVSPQPSTRARAHTHARTP